MILGKRGIDAQSIQRRTRHERTCPFGDVETGPREGVNVEMRKPRLVLRGQDCGVGSGLLSDDIELDLRPVPDLVKAHRRLTLGAAE